MIGLSAALGALALLAGGGPAAAATTLNAGWSSDCGKATCFNDQGSYSVVFSKGSFSGPVDISRLFLDRSVLGTMGSQFFSMSFTLNGKSIGSWGDWNMSAVSGDTLSLWGSDLIWNPADGDLVMVIDLVTPDGQKLGSRWFNGWYVDDGRPGSRGHADIGEGDGSGPPPFLPGEPPPFGGPAFVGRAGSPGLGWKPPPFGGPMFGGRPGSVGAGWKPPPFGGPMFVGRAGSPGPGRNPPPGGGLPGRLYSGRCGGPPGRYPPPGGGA